jgi:energy-coupling factor transport system permease protein
MGASSPRSDIAFGISFSEQMSRILQDISIGGYLPGHSFLHRLDPRTKLVGFMMILVCVFTAKGVFAAVASGIIVIGLACASGVGLRVWYWGLARFAWMLAFAAGLNIFLHSGGAPVFVFGKELPLTDQGLVTGLLFAAELVQAIILSMALTFTTTPRDLTRGCQRLARPLKRINVPVDEMAVVLLLAMRFVPLLQLEVRNIIDAQKSRGIDFNHGGLVARAGNLAAVLVPALLATLRRGDLLADAMAARGFRPGAPRSDFNPLRFSKLDCIAFACITTFCVLRIFLLR